MPRLVVSVSWERMVKVDLLIMRPFVIIKKEDSGMYLVACRSFTTVHFSEVE